LQAGRREVTAGVIGRCSVRRQRLVGKVARWWWWGRIGTAVVVRQRGRKVCA